MPEREKDHKKDDKKDNKDTKKDEVAAASQAATQLNNTTRSVEERLAEFQREHPEEAGKQVRTIDSPIGGLEYPSQFKHYVRVQHSGGIPVPPDAVLDPAAQSEDATRKDKGYSPTGASPASRKPRAGGESEAEENVILEKVDLAVNGLNFQGVCERCGWQTYQSQEQLAHDGVIQHLAGTHNLL